MVLQTPFFETRYIQLCVLVGGADMALLPTHPHRRGGRGVLSPCQAGVPGEGLGDSGFRPWPQHFFRMPGQHSPLCSVPRFRGTAMLGDHGVSGEG